MTFSPKNITASELLTDAPLSEGTLSYLEERAKNSFYDYVITKFKEAERCGLTKAALARKLNKRPDHISKIMGSPGNWTLGMIASLLAAICREEILPYSLSYLGRPPRNISAKDLAREEKWPSPPVPKVGNYNEVQIKSPGWV